MLDKKELKKQYKQTLTPMGIFQIKNLVSGKIFIENGKNLPGSINSAKFQLKMGTYMNEKLQKDYNELGEEKFSFEVIDSLEPKEDLSYDYTEDLNVLKEMWLDKLQPFDEKGYHKRKVQL